MTTEKHAFTTEVQELLNLMVHSLYSNKDIFLRELISNSSDALDRLSVEGLTDSELLPADELHIRLEADKDARTLTMQDNGIGMTREDLVRDIGTIARSGTKQFLKALENKRAEGAGDEAPAADLIGQFGVGFYSAFMVADEVTIVTRRAGEDMATRWVSTGDGTYTVEDGTRAEAGTTIVLHLKEVDEEDGRKDYADPWVLTEIVKKHSDFVSYPIRMRKERQEPTLDDDGKPVPGALPKFVTEDSTLNSMKAIWTRPRSEVSDEEYKEFYRHISHDWGEPMETLTARMEGAFNARLLLFIPSKAPHDIQYRDGQTRGVHLYVKRVFIMEDWETLIPPWMRFVRGVIDAEDLSLNVSREILQKDRQVRAIRKFAAKKVLDTIDGLKKNRLEDMHSFWGEFGQVLKEGLVDNETPKERILDLVLCHTTQGAEPTFLDAYVERMAEDQETIYYLTGTSLETLRKSPHLEGFAAKDVEVLLFADPIDEFWLSANPEYAGKRFVSVGAGEADIADEAAEDEEKQEQDDSYKDLLLAMRDHLQGEVKEVRLSARLTDSPACLVGDTDDMTPQLAEMMRRMGQEVPKPKRILELNPKHAFVEKLQDMHAASATDPDLETFAKLLHSQALLAEGGKIEDPSALSAQLLEVMLKAAAAKG